ncbi:MAG: hypothetical protein LCH56_17835 [Proteobacteria bacterium]|nr:hypothetical protein [Pseudomonadota bacterium]
MRHKTVLPSALAASFAGAVMCAAPAAADGPEILGLQNKTIGFALTSTRWGIYETKDGKQECPNGFNAGPRDQFKALYPEGGTVEGTQLEREIAVRHPTEKEDRFPYNEIEGKIGIGLNLDGKIGAKDFTSPDGEKGIDNAFYRAIGCIRMFRGEASYAHFTELWVREFENNRILVELTDVDNLQNDDHVVVNLYRGKDKLIMDVNGQKVMPGGSNRVDDRFSKKYTTSLKGKIENGVLTTEPADIHWAWSSWYSDPYGYLFKQARLRVKLDPSGETAEGLLGGYNDIDTFRQTLLRGYSTHHSGYGDMSQPSMSRALFRNADGIPGPDGKNTAISSSLVVKFTQVFIQHPDAKVAEAPPGAATSR